MRAKQINVIAVWVGLALSLLALTVSTMSFFRFGKCNALVYPSKWNFSQSRNSIEY